MGVLKETGVAEILVQASARKDAGHLEAAEKLYRYVLQQDPQNSMAQKELHKLLKIIRKTTRKDRRRTTRKSGNDRKKKHQLSVSGSEPRQKDIDGLVAAYNNGQFDVAERKAQLLAKKFPRAIIPFNLLGLAHAGQGRFEDAIESYNQALEINPDFAPAHNNLAVALKNLGRFEEAVTCFRRATETDPDLAEAHSNLGNTLSTIGNPTEGAACCRQALKINPGLAEAHGNLGNALRKLGQQEEAIACYIAALRLKPDYLDVLNRLAETLRYAGSMKVGDELKNLVVRCFEIPWIDNTAIRRVSEAILKVKLQTDQEPDSQTFREAVERDRATRALLIAHLRNHLVADQELEEWLTSVRTGLLEIGDLAVWVGVASAHRDEAFKACRYIIDELKVRLPIWKKEHYVDGDSGWVNCERCAAHGAH